MKSHDPIRSERRLLEALRAVETATLALRDYAATSCRRDRPQREARPSARRRLPGWSCWRAGWLAVTLEAVLPRRGDSDRSRFLAHSLRAAIRRAFPDRLPPKFHICVLAYEHIYGPGRRFLDHDNLELKHCQDVLEAAFLTNDTSALCSAFQCSRRGERNATRIWVLPAEAFPRWLETPSGVLGRTTGNLKQ